MDESREICLILKQKLELIYQIFDELTVFIGNSKEVNIFGLNDESTLKDYSDFTMEIQNNSAFADEIGKLFLGLILR
jgi:tetrahydromethanopterin S-methyltransferase subunit H